MSYKTSIPLFVLFAFILTLSACKKDDSTYDLQNYIDDHKAFTPFNELIACAAGGQVGFLDDEAYPLNMFFKPQPSGSVDYRYYETTDLSDDPNDLSNFVEIPLSSEPMLNGFLRRFKLEKPDKDVWARVSYLANDTLWYCKAVKMKYNNKPSEHAPQLLTVDSNTPLSPQFSWEDGAADDNVIYFQVIGDSDGNAVSGTYTTDRFFQFYDLNNVVLNVTHPDMNPALEANKEYTFTMMGVSEDNWVNLIITGGFDTK